MSKADNAFWHEVVAEIGRLDPNLGAAQAIERVARFRQVMRAHEVPDSQLYHRGENAVAQAIVDQGELSPEDLAGTNRPPSFQG